MRRNGGRDGRATRRIDGRALSSELSASEVGVGVGGEGRGRAFERGGAGGGRGVDDGQPGREMG